MARRATVLLFLVATHLAGCAAGVGGGGYHGGPCPLHAGERSLISDEIDAAARLAFDNSKADALASVAARPDLTPGEQEYLVCVTSHVLTFDHDRVRVLETLIDNPAFSPRAKSAILHNLDAFPFDHTRTQLLHRMRGRGDAAPMDP
jgi:hypothetical protein